MGERDHVNVPAHRPRASDANLETTALSRGSVQPAGSVFYDLLFSSCSISVGSCGAGNNLLSNSSSTGN